MSIEASIVEWALTRPGWQQDVLVAASKGEELDEQGVVELADTIVAGTAAAPTNEAKAIELRPATPLQVWLSSISEASGVNALVEGQTLDFGMRGLTVVYGDNGSGKSGYARLVKALVSARHRPTILPNVFTPTTTPPSCTLRFEVAGQKRAFAFPGDTVPELEKMRFYDEHCGESYLTRESSVSYRPSALTVIDALIRVCDQVRAELATRISTTEAAALDLDLAPGTPAATFAGGLRASTSAAEITTATTLPTGHDQRRADAITEEARLRSTDPTKEQERLRDLARHVSRLATDLATLVDVLSVERTLTRVALRDKARTARTTAAVAAGASFDDLPLPGVGSDTWRTLWETARSYSTAEVDHEHPFPALEDDSRCVLCQQVLSAEARTRMGRFDAYMTDTTERDAAAAETAAVTAVEQLRALAFTTPAQSAALTALAAHDAALSAQAATLIDAMQAHRDAISAHLATTDAEAAPAPPTTGDLPARLSALATQLSEQAESLDPAAFAGALASASRLRHELEAASQLAEAAPRVHAEVARLARLSALTGARSSADTTAISKKAAELAETFAADQVQRQFHAEAVNLRLDRVAWQKVKVTKGQISQKFALQGASAGSTPSAVLSEGEQTALGLAGFFTEAVFDDSRSAIILDDPVTSLDHGRRTKVAERLVEFAKDRQVVVFTHDVAFVTSLSAACAREDVTLTSRAVERRGSDPGVCLTSFPWNAKDFGQRTNLLETRLAAMRKARPDLEQSLWEEQVASWAGFLSETWERCIVTDILNEVFDRGSSEVRVRMFRVLARITAADDVDLQTGYGATSRWGRRHDKAPETQYQAPEPDELEEELVRIRAWRKRVRGYLNATT